MGQTHTQSLEGALWYPLARTQNLVTSESDSDLLVYDHDTQQIHHLNASSVAVWTQCDGSRTDGDIAVSLGLSLETVHIALGSLAQANLLAGPIPSNLVAPGRSRRSFLRKAAIAGGVALPTIVSITAPQAAAAYSEGSQECISGSLFPLGTGCNQHAQCCSQYCDQAFLGGPGTCAPPPPD